MTFGRRELAIRSLAIRSLAIRSLTIRSLTIRSLTILSLTILSLTTSCGDQQPNSRDEFTSATSDSMPAHPAPAASRDTGRVVGTEMRHVDFHIDDGIVLRIDRLHGALVPTVTDGIATFDVPESFALELQSATIAIDTVSLGVLPNRHVFGYPGSPLRHLKIGIKGNELVQQGTLHKGVDVPFRVQATLSLMPEGKIRLHPTSVRVTGVGVGRVMRLFGMHLHSLVKLQRGHGAAIEGDDFILDPTEILPAPRIRGRLTSIAIAGGRVVQTFGDAHAQRSFAPFADSTHFPNYMYFRGGLLRFGKLTMADADLVIVDEAPQSPFDFSLKDYNRQLVAGYSRNTTALGLVVHMPDLASLRRR
jgi:hypothetical protein